MDCLEFKSIGQIKILAVGFILWETWIYVHIFTGIYPIIVDVCCTVSKPFTNVDLHSFLGLSPNIPPNLINIYVTIFITDGKWDLKMYLLKVINQSYKVTFTQKCWALSHKTRVKDFSHRPRIDETRPRSVLCSSISVFVCFHGHMCVCEIISSECVLLSE